MTASVPKATGVSVPPFTVWVPGESKTQGSKRGYAVNRSDGSTGVRMVEQVKGVKSWREDIAWSLRSETPREIRALWPLEGPLALDVLFVLKRPSGAPKRRNPPACRKRNDTDKLLRAVFDAVSLSGAWVDDGHCIATNARKRFAKLDEAPGCLITIRQVPDGAWDEWE